MAAGSQTPPAHTATQQQQQQQPNLPPPPVQPAQQGDSERLASELRAREEENARLKAALNRAQAPRQAPQAQPAPPQQPLDKKQLEDQFWRDPLAMSGAIAQHAVASMLAENQAATFDTLREVARSKARERNPELFDRFAAEIDQLVNVAPPQYHTNINVWLNAYNSVVGQHSADLIREAKEKGGPSAGRAGDGPQPPSARPPAASPPGGKLTEEEREMAKNLGLTPEQYAHGKELHESAAEYNELRDVKAPYKWDEVITFDSRRPAKITPKPRRGGKEAA